MGIEKTIENETDTRIPDAYQDKEYKEHRASWLGTIPKSNVLNAIKNNFGQINLLLASTVVAAVVTGLLKLSVVGVVAIAVGAVACAAISTYAGYLDEKMSKTTDRAYSEARQIMDSRVNGIEMANALKETLGEELKDARAENRQMQQALTQTQQRMQSWQEREAEREPQSQMLH